MTEELPRPCPVCGVELEVLEIKDVEIDVCADHGVWLDNGELERLIELKQPKVDEGAILPQTPKRRRARRRRMDRRDKREAALRRQVSVALWL